MCIYPSLYHIKNTCLAIYEELGIRAETEMCIYPSLYHIKNTCLAIYEELGLEQRLRCVYITLCITLRIPVWLQETLEINLI